MILETFSRGLLVTMLCTALPSWADEFCESVNKWVAERGADSFTSTMADMTVNGDPRCMGLSCPDRAVRKRMSKAIAILWDDGKIALAGPLESQDKSRLTLSERAARDSLFYSFHILRGVQFDPFPAEFRPFSEDDGSILYIVRPRTDLIEIISGPNKYNVDFGATKSYFSDTNEPCVTVFSSQEMFPVLHRAQVLVDSDSGPENINACIVGGTLAAMGIDTPSGERLFDDPWGRFPPPKKAPELLYTWSARDLMAVSILYGGLEAGMDRDAATSVIKGFLDVCRQPK